VIVALALSFALATSIERVVLRVDAANANCSDTGGEPYCSLVDAMAEANRKAKPVRIEITRGHQVLARPTARNGDEGNSGLPTVSGDIEIEGNSTVIERLKHAPPFRLFHVAAGGTLTLRNVVLRSGESSAYSDGGAIWNAGTLRVFTCTFDANTAGDDGGAIRNDGVMEVVSSSFLHNRTTGDGGVGGAIYNVDIAGPATATITDCTFEGNDARDKAGAIWNAGTIEIAGSSFIDNSARRHGGALQNNGRMIVRRSRIAGNRTRGSGGGIFSLSRTTLEDVSIRGNAANVGRACDGIMSIDEKTEIDDRDGCAVTIEESPKARTAAGAATQ
jgi:predicted outer membrane repeat protein